MQFSKGKKENQRGISKEKVLVKLIRIKMPKHIGIKYPQIKLWRRKENKGGVKFTFKVPDRFCIWWVSVKNEISLQTRYTHLPFQSVDLTREDKKKEKFPASSELMVSFSDPLYPW